VPGLPSTEGVHELSELLELGAHGVTAIMATWLGLLVLTRAWRAPGAPVFSFLCLLLVLWSVAIIVQRIGADPSVKPAVNLVEDLSAFLLPAATLHIALLVAVEGRRTTLATTLVSGGYLVGTLAGLQAIIDPEHPIGFTLPSFAPFGLPPTAVAWAFLVARALIFGAGIAYLVAGLRESGEDRARRRQVQFALATVVLGVIGGMARILPEEIGGPRWVGVSIVAVAIVMATYAILAQHVFVAADVAGRAVRGSLFAGLGVVVYVGALVGLEATASRVLAIDLPIVTALAVVVTLALFDPIADRVQALLAGTPRAAAEERLLQALGSDPMLAQNPEQAVEPAVARLVRTFELTGAEVVDARGKVRARMGTIDLIDPLGMRLDLRADGTETGVATFGRKRNGLSFTPPEVDALTLAASYLGSSLHLAERQHVQASALADLRQERAVVQSRGSALSTVLADAATPLPGLRVYALGSLRAELDGEPVRRWGGEKAGSRQAEAIFAFLFDRGDRGASKDEILELVWPDVDLERADVAFHRTMLGLRSMLKPGMRSRGTAGPVGFSNDRYRLDPSVVAWSDTSEFERLLSEAAVAEPEMAMGVLERARTLYRGDYLDDCPYYGDSAQVEDRRSDLRQRYVDILVDLGERYAQRGDRAAAATSYRQAQAVADDEMPHIAEALGRLTGARPPEPA
jgi:DNA-binding SARP family transcriptional activator